jgi:superfamily II DNA/RNA helicase
MTFSDLNLDANILKTLEKQGYKTPTPVQLKVIPRVIEGSDLRVSAPTGTGKTAAFLLPIMDQLIKSPPSNGKGPRVLILVPTRELATQVASQAEKYSRNLARMKTVCVYGGVPYHTQNRELTRHHEIVVATPGRLIDHLDRGTFSLDRVEVLVLDEADRMLDMGFSEPVQRIANAIPKGRQTLLFSATLKGNVLSLSNKLLNNPLEINVHAEVDKGENIDQRIHYVDDLHHKHKVLDHLLSNPEITQAIIFTSTKRQADKLSENLSDRDFSVAALHGDMSQRHRTRTIMQLRNGKVRFLIATDVAARGIDVKTISHVINFDLPTNNEDYVHRIGRTGRAGATGVACSLATTGEYGIVRSIEQFTGKAMTCDVIPGLEPTGKIAANSSSNSRRRFGGGGGGGGGQRRGQGGGQRRSSSGNTGFSRGPKRSSQGGSGNSSQGGYGRSSSAGGSRRPSAAGGSRRPSAAGGGQRSSQRRSYSGNK